MTAPAVASPKSVDLGRADEGNRIVYRNKGIGCLVIATMPFALIGLFIGKVFWAGLSTGNYGPATWFIGLLALLLLGLPLLMLWSGLRPRLILTSERIVMPGMFGTKKLDFSGMRGLGIYHGEFLYRATRNADGEGLTRSRTVAQSRIVMMDADGTVHTLWVLPQRHAALDTVIEDLHRMAGVEVEALETDSVGSSQKPATAHW